MPPPTLYPTSAAHPSIPATRSPCAAPRLSAGSKRPLPGTDSSGLQPGGGLRRDLSSGIEWRAFRYDSHRRANGFSEKRGADPVDEVRVCFDHADLCVVVSDCWNL